jgi:hypothetical protein
MGAYRRPDRPAPEWERAADAFYDLVAALRRLQKRTLLLPAIAAAVLGTVGVLAHVQGYWSVLGVNRNGGYYLHPVTLVIAFVLPCAPVLALAFGAYRLARRRLVARWMADASRKHDLEPSVLAERARAIL